MDHSDTIGLDLTWSFTETKLQTCVLVSVLPVGDVPAANSDPIGNTDEEKQTANIIKELLCNTFGLKYPEQQHNEESTTLT